MESEFNLGEVFVRPSARTLEVDGEVRQIDYKAMQVLLCLVKRPGCTVTKQEIFNEVWRQDFVTNEVLTVAISRLRRALGDQARSPRFIETVPQVGYRLIAAVNQAPGKAESFTALPPAEPEEPPRRRWLVMATAVASLFTVICFAGFAGRDFIERWSSESSDEGISALAVLPLTNLTGDSDQEYIAEGITEALITGLAGQGNLRVVSRAAVRRYQEDRPDLAEIARELGVDALLEGSVQRSGELLRVSARLTDASGDRHLWAETFDGELKNILDLQHQALTAISRRLDANPDHLERSLSPVDPAAYEAYLRGRYLLERTATSHRLYKAIHELETAIALEPEYGDAHLASAQAWLTLGENVLVPPRRAFAEVRRATERALELGQNPASAHAFLAMVSFLHD